MHITRCAALFAFTASIAFAEPLDKAEAQFWEFSSVSGSVENLQSFLDAYPDSQFVEEAQQMIADLEDDQRRLQLENFLFEQIGDVTYDGILKFGNEHTIGKSLAQITKTSPAFSPVEGIPDEVWKEKSCASCHQWTREDLCAQAKTYISKRPVKYQEKQHPFGGMLKINMRNWALGDCK